MLASLATVTLKFKLTCTFNVLSHSMSESLNTKHETRPFLVRNFVNVSNLLKFLSPGSEGFSQGRRVSHVPWIQRALGKTLWQVRPLCCKNTMWPKEFCKTIISTSVSDSSGSLCRSCVACPAGEYKPATGTGLCLGCPAGTYRSVGRYIAYFSKHVSKHQLYSSRL